MGIFIKSHESGIFHTLKFHLHALSPYLWLNLWPYPPRDNEFSSFTAMGSTMSHATGYQTISRFPCINSLAPGRFQFNFRKVIFMLTLLNGGWGVSYEIALRWKPKDLTDDKSTLVQVMAWCRQATSHYLRQCWPRSMSPNGVNRPQWVDILLDTYILVNAVNVAHLAEETT